MRLDTIAAPGRAEVKFTSGLAPPVYLHDATAPPRSPQFDSFEQMNYWKGLLIPVS